jgi:hypothetical protein
MKKYTKPSAEVSKFEIEEAVMMDTSTTDPDPDGGWGDIL